METPAPALGPVEKGGEEESAFTLEPPPFTHTHRRAHPWDEGGLSDAVSMLRRHKASKGWAEGRGKDTET